MNNDDFRRLLATPRAERFGGETPAAGKSGQAQAQAKAKPTGEYRPKPKPGFKKPTDKKKEDEDEDGPKYRYDGSHGLGEERSGHAGRGHLPAPTRAAGMGAAIGDPATPMCMLT